MYVIKAIETVLELIVFEEMQFLLGTNYSLWFNYLNSLRWRAVYMKKGKCNALWAEWITVVIEMVCLIMFLWINLQRSMVCACVWCLHVCFSVKPGLSLFPTFNIVKYASFCAFSFLFFFSFEGVGGAEGNSDSITWVECNCNTNSFQKVVP